MAFEVEALNLLDYIYDKMILDFSHELNADIDLELFSIWKDKAIHNKIFL